LGCEAGLRLSRKIYEEGWGSSETEICLFPLFLCHWDRGHVGGRLTPTFTERSTKAREALSVTSQPKRILCYPCLP
jgi:hypothetical protein